MAEAEPAVGGREEGIRRTGFNLLPEQALRLFVDVGQVLHALHKEGRGDDQLDHGRALAGGERGRQGGEQVGEVDVVHGHVDTNVIAPLLGEGIEPLVILRDEVTPLEELKLRPGRELLHRHLHHRGRHLRRLRWRRLLIISAGSENKKARRHRQRQSPGGLA